MERPDRSDVFQDFLDATSKKYPGRNGLLGESSEHDLTNLDLACVTQLEKKKEIHPSSRQ